MENKPFSEEEFRKIYSRVPRLAIVLAIRGPEGIVLALRKSHGWEGMWHLPGMTMLYEESVQQTIERIAREETGLQVISEKLLGYIEYPSERDQRGYGTTVALVFQCAIQGGMLRANEDASDIQFFQQLPSSMIAEERFFLETRAGF